MTTTIKPYKLRGGPGQRAATHRLNVDITKRKDADAAKKAEKAAKAKKASRRRTSTTKSYHNK